MDYACSFCLYSYNHLCEAIRFCQFTSWCHFLRHFYTTALEINGLDINLGFVLEPLFFLIYQSSCSLQLFSSKLQPSFPTVSKLLRKNKTFFLQKINKETGLHLGYLNNSIETASKSDPRLIISIVPSSWCTIKSSKFLWDKILFYFI